MERDRRHRPTDEELRAEVERLASNPDDVREMREIARMMAFCSLPVGESSVSDDEIKTEYLKSVLRRALVNYDDEADLAQLRSLALGRVRRDLEGHDLVADLLAERRRAAGSASATEI